MKRLIDDVENAAKTERLTELVSAAEPFRPNPFTKRRVLLRLQQMGGGQRPLLKAWSAAAGLIFIVGSAVAGTAWWRAHTDLGHSAATATPPSITSPALSPPPSPPPPPAPPSADEPPLPPLEATPSDTAARGNDGPPPKIRPSQHRVGAIVHETTASRAPATSSNEPIPLSPPAAGGEDPTPVVRAIRALRSERNPARAEQLLQEYLRTNPEGALAEDALALLIETASALRSPSAADRAARYLELYPNGRYRATARRVISALP